MRKKLCSQIIYENSEMKALCSKIKKHDFSILSLHGVLENGHFKNVQKPFTAIRSNPIFFRLFKTCAKLYKTGEIALETDEHMKQTQSPF